MLSNFRGILWRQGQLLAANATAGLSGSGLLALPTTVAQQQAQQAAAIYTALNSGLSGSSTTRGNGVDPWSNKVGVVTSSANSDYNSLQVSVSRAVEGCFSAEPRRRIHESKSHYRLRSGPTACRTSGRNFLWLNSLIEFDWG